MAGRQPGIGVAGRGGDRKAEISDPAMERAVAARDEPGDRGDRLLGRIPFAPQASYDEPLGQQAARAGRSLACARGGRSAGALGGRSREAVNLVGRLGCAIDGWRDIAALLRPYAAVAPP